MKHLFMFFFFGYLVESSVLSMANLSDGPANRLGSDREICVKSERCVATDTRRCKIYGTASQGVYCPFEHLLGYDLEAYRQDAKAAKDHRWLQLYSHKNFDLLPQRSCGIVKTVKSARIMRGRNGTRLPWMVLIIGGQYSLGRLNKFQCGGTLISANYVLSAAHCAVTKNLIAHLGEYHLLTDEDCFSATDCWPKTVTMSIVETIIHPRYDNKRLIHDIALFRLARSVDFGKGSPIVPICLPFAKSLGKLPRRAYAAGWGVTEDGQTSGELLTTLLPIRTIKACRTYGNTEGIICAGGIGGKDTCDGDSGGPLANVAWFNGRLRYVLYGIVSYGPEICGSFNMPAVYTRVDVYLEWILDSLRP